MYNGEADLLEIRLNILDSFVDKFVLCESSETFSGEPKPLYFQESGDRFNKWKDKMIVVNPPPIETTDSFERAGYQKDWIRNVLKDCDPEDVIYFGDVDEIWKSQEKEGKLRQLCYSYYLNNRSSEDWQGTNVCKYKNLYNLNEWRANHDVILEDGGWHFTNMGGYDELIRKIESYDHQEVNIPWVKDGLKARMEANIDFLGRLQDWQGKPFTFWKDESDLPKYILDRKGEWKDKGLWK
jgi:beta-1,4-mannosyl-glycoprotein beta-1,4-N-acetylglucosaminyltransferase